MSGPAVRRGQTIRDNDPRHPDSYYTVFIVDGARVVAFPFGQPNKPHLRTPLDYVHPFGSRPMRTGYTVVSDLEAERKTGRAKA